MAFVACACAPDEPASAPQPSTDREGPLGRGTYQTIDTVDDEGRTTRVTTFRPTPASDAALDALRAACDRQELESCRALGHQYLLAARHADAEAVYKAACDAGDGTACADLGAQYLNPYVHLPHPEWALDVLTRGCEAEVHPPMACASLAEVYEDGRFGAPRDPARRAELLARACDDGHYWSCQAIGRPLPQ